MNLILLGDIKRSTTKYYRISKNLDYLVWA